MVRTPGYLVYARQDGNVYAQPFDVKTLSLSGSPVPLVSNVRTLAWHYPRGGLQ